MHTYAVYLWPRSALASELGSDTLFGAVCWAIRVLGLTNVDEMLGHFDPPRFAFSSPFPVRRERGQVLRLYPRPLWFDVSPAELERLWQAEMQRHPEANQKALKLKLIDRAKELNKAGWVSEEVFRQVVTGQTNVQHAMQPPAGGNARPAEIELTGGVIVTPTERSRLLSDGATALLRQPVAIQHNQIDRVAGATVEGLLFYVNEIRFAHGAGLWCLVRAEPGDAESLIRPALRYLADTGLGADRTTGKGHFDIEMVDAPALPDAGKSANGWLSLSRYLPRAGEWRAHERPLRYRLTSLWAKREQRYPRPEAGRSVPVYKRRLRVFEPGSVFPLTTPKEIYGRLAEVVPAPAEGWTTYQSGLALGVAAHVPDVGG